MKFRLLALIALVLGLSRMALSAEMPFFPKVSQATASPSVAASLATGHAAPKVSKRKVGKLARWKRSWRERFVRRMPAVKPQVPLLPPPPPPLAFDVPSVVREAWQDRIHAEAFIPGVTPQAKAPATVSVSQISSPSIPKPGYWSVEYMTASAMAQSHDARYRAEASPQVRYRFRL